MELRDLIFLFCEEEVFLELHGYDAFGDECFLWEGSSLDVPTEYKSETINQIYPVADGEMVVFTDYGLKEAIEIEDIERELYERNC